MYLYREFVENTLIRMTFSNRALISCRFENAELNLDAPIKYLLQIVLILLMEETDTSGRYKLGGNPYQRCTKRLAFNPISARGGGEIHTLEVFPSPSP